MSHMHSYSQSHKQFQRCKKCFKLIIDGRMLKEQICGAIYCPRCICQLYQSHYLNHQPDIIIQLYCSHYVDRKLILNFLLTNCINCGSKYDPKYDLEMRDGAKLCKVCFNYEEAKYKDFLLECLSCNRIIRSFSFLAESEVVICKECVKSQSQMHSMIVKEKSSLNVKEKNPERVNASEQKGEEEQPSEASIVSKFNGMQGNLHSEYPKHKINLTSKSSTQIRVENLKIKIPYNLQQKNRCVNCNCFISDGGIIKNSKQQIQCKLCFTQTFDPRQFSFSKSFLRPSVEERNKHTSAPKHKLLGHENSTEKVRAMKKSVLVQGDLEKSSLNVLDTNKLALTGGVKNVPKIQPWQQFMTKNENLCETCQTKKYMIIRSDKKKVCSACYNK